MEIDEKGFIVQKGARVIDRSVSLDILDGGKIEFLTDEELAAIPTGSVFFFDVETFPNFWMVAFRHSDSGKFVIFERSPGAEFNPAKLRWMLWRFLIVGFNSNNYDVPMIEYALTGADCAELKRASDYIINSGPAHGTSKVTPFGFEKAFNLRIGRYNHIDLFNVCPVNGGLTAMPASLKLYAARLHAPLIQDLPFEPSHCLTAEDAEVVRLYCCNDLQDTELLFNELAPEIKLRVEMGERYGVDLRSRSDAQIAESVIVSELEKVLGYRPKRPEVEISEAIRYSVPGFIGFQTPELQGVLETIRKAEFYLDGLGSPTMPPEMKNLTVTIGKGIYRIGMGGLHSSEKATGHTANEDVIIADNDVESFYPRTILNQRLYPAHLGEAFLKAYGGIVETRLKAKAEASAAKKAGDREAAKRAKTISDTLKIVINGSFGKFGNKYSALYAPQLMLQVTITGQLVLLMLIEAFELAGLEVISANTDGFVSKYPKARHDEARAIIESWEAHTQYKTEETRYVGLYSRDVNNYFALTEGGDSEARFLDEREGVKTKGAYCERGSALNSVLSANPDRLICKDAAILFMKRGIPVEKTVRECRDIRRFVGVRNVRGGGEKGGRYVGRVARWYYAKGETGGIRYIASGNLVGTTEGGRPVMKLPAEFPKDVDYDRYISDAIEILHDCGFLKRISSRSLFD